jgi:hypothetical protein
VCIYITYMLDNKRPPTVTLSRLVNIYYPSSNGDKIISVSKERGERNIEYERKTFFYPSSFYLGGGLLSPIFLIYSFRMKETVCAFLKLGPLLDFIFYSSNQIKSDHTEVVPVVASGNAINKYCCTMHLISSYE